VRCWRRPGGCPASWARRPRSCASNPVRDGRRRRARHAPRRGRAGRRRPGGRCDRLLKEDDAGRAVLLLAGGRTELPRSRAPASSPRGARPRSTW
jgi:hypothetical protein